MSKTFETVLKEIEKIDKSLSKLQKLILNTNDEEKKQMYTFMEYLEREYKILQIKLWNEERNKKI